MTIAYDVYTMQELTRACQAANDELQNAQNLIQQVHSHSDWTCKEKDAIDDLMQECKNIVKRLCEDQFSFLEAVKSVGEELLEAESSVSRLFSGVESILQKILSIPVAETVVSGAGLVIDGISDMFDNVASAINHDNSAVNQWTAIPGSEVVSAFEDIGLGVSPITEVIGTHNLIDNFDVASILTSTIDIASAPTLVFK